MRSPIDNAIETLLKEKHAALEKQLETDVLTINGPLIDGLDFLLLQITEQLAESPDKKDKMSVILITNGGDAITVERIVEILRKHYKEVNFIIPDRAYSAGTIFCMSGDKIFMDYYSILGPIDPQVQTKDRKLVAAMGYLDKISELVEKAKNGQITVPESIILKEFDLAELRSYEQARDLTIDLLKKWLVKYKFKDWKIHSSTGAEVTNDDRVKRAEEIAKKLSDSNEWKSHGRPLGIETLRSLKLKIEDYGENPDFQKLIREYHRIMVDYVQKNEKFNFIQTREFLL